MKTGKTIAIVGAPRSGKSFLCKKLSEKYGYDYFLEGNNDTFPKFIEEDIKNNTNGLRRILWFRNTQIKNFLEAQELAMNKTVLVDTFWVDNIIYRDLLLNGNDLEVARGQSEIDMNLLPWPDKIIYLKNSEEKTLEFLTLGGRTFDHGNVFSETIKPLIAKYDELMGLIPKHIPTLVLERGSLDFEKDEDLRKVVEFI